MQSILFPYFTHLCDQFTPKVSAQSINDTLLLAVSGGADSVALLCGVVALYERAVLEAKNSSTSENTHYEKNVINSKNIYFANSGIVDDAETADVETDWRQRLVVVHFDHAVRPDSGKDAEFVRHLAETHGLRFVIGRREPDTPTGYRITAADSKSAALRKKRLSTVPASHTIPQAFPISPILWDAPKQDKMECVEKRDAGVLSEERLRGARYQFLRCEAERLGATTILLAHTLDDQIETVLYRILRGTGIRGLGGIPPVRTLGPWVTLVRPMLHIRRVEIEAALREIGQSWREDSSNRDPKYTRNRIRHELLPLLESQYAPGVRESLSRLARLATEVQQDIDCQIETIYHLAVEIHIESFDKHIQTNIDSRNDFPNRFSDSSSNISVATSIQKDITVKKDNTDTKSPNIVPLPIIRVFRKPLETVSDYMVKEIFQRLWRDQRWSLAAMGFEHWNTLLQMVRGKLPRKNVFPGRIIVTVKRNTLWFDISERINTHE